MPNFFCLYSSKTTDSLNIEARLVSLKAACKKYNIRFCLIDEAKADFSNLPVPTDNDGLYNCARGSYLLEKTMLNNKERTFYRAYNYLSFQDDSNLINIELEKQGISVPKTIYKGSNEKQLLQQYVNYLDRFPVVIKTYGGTGGLGVIKVDNYATLFSLTDYLASQNINFQIKQFIVSHSCERLTVLGDKVIYANTRPTKPDDFRSDLYSKKAHRVNLPDEINKIAINATHAANLNYGGVDLIISSKNGKPYILEVNCPQNFAIHEQVTGESYAEKMIEFLFFKL
ncbi:ATP-grasp domain-containing protein [Niabella drilacis]|uniref:RimK-like ATP-grasp domain-containing protein n=1 Tax=Niabella drilacis (strain DSM 25811 / CCM 8410 / CCUG 62505 / LMG 26954 / E90) TaxID=1285928 RepID=A0A1G7BWQ6_NIADE|nr:ATP-grasp domain-containing protein [Niabella drilacis]SDE31449.1 RimK-like ATP-grasp domain-containing protein [Niabella drilacis]